MNNYVLGIDLGTTNSVASVWNGDNYTLIKNKNLNYFPSVINFTENGKLICELNDEFSIRNTKRFIGCDNNDLNLLKLLNDINTEFKFIDSKIMIYNKFEDKFYSIEELHALILKKIVQTAENQLDYKINDVVITIPSHFNQNQRNSVIISSQIAKLNCIRIINEPTSASLAYGLKYHNDVNLLVFDLGGGTLDITFLNSDDGLFEILKTTGDNLLGGEDFTKLIINDVISSFIENNKNYKINENILKKKYSLLRNLCEEFKCGNIKNICIPNFYDDQENNIQLSLNYNKKRNEISHLFSHLIDRIKNILDIFLIDDSKNDINYIVLVGGSTKLIELKSFLNYYFKNISIVNNLDPDLVVSFGASIQGYLINNPDCEFSQNIALVDILPLSIGVESDEGSMAKIIEKGTKLPVTRKKYFTNDKDYQNEVDVNIYQGEREFIKDNILIGNFKLQNLKLKKKNMNIIIIEVNVDKNGIINISAVEKGSNNNKKITIKKEDNEFSKETIDKMIEESIKYDKIDSYKLKCLKLINLLTNQINNLDYNCNYNQFVNLSKNELDILSSYILEIKSKFTVLKEKYNNKDKTNEDYEYIIDNLKKILKVNKLKYSFLVDNYEVNKDDCDYEKINENTSNHYNKLFVDLINKNIDSINKNNDISKYSKELIIHFLQNKVFKINSISLDQMSYDENINDLYNHLDNIIKNDNVIINNYGNIETISSLLSNNNIDYDVTKFNDLNNKDKFNLLFEICRKFNIEIN